MVVCEYACSPSNPTRVSSKRVKSECPARMLRNSAKSVCQVRAGVLQVSPVENVASIVFVY